MDRGTPRGLIGAPIRRVEDHRLLTGRGRYVADLVLPGMLHAAFLRSLHAHARILSVHRATAQALAGVAAIATWNDLRDHARPIRAASRMTGYHATDFPPLAADKVRYVGEAIAVVAADSRYAAEDAVDQIGVDYEPLEPGGDPRTAMDDRGPLLHEAAGTNVPLTRAFSQGHGDTAFVGPAVVVGDRFCF